MFQVIINQVGLSLGETEAINNLFSDYYITENIIDNDFEFASILEIEFLKDKSIEFFDFIPIEKWSILIEIVKNIKKRRGRKGLKLKFIIIDIGKSNYKNNNNDGNDGKEKDKQEIIFRETSFLLNHKNDLDFIKGLERIEITIESLSEMYEFQKLKEEKETNDKTINENDKNRVEGKNSIIFTFNEINRKWIRFTDKTSSIKKSK